MIRLLLLLLIPYCNQQAFTQDFEKIVLNPADSTSGYYLSVKPHATEIRGVLVLLDGFGGRAEQIFPETKLHHVAQQNGILTVGMAQGNKIYADSMVVQRMNAVFRDVMQRYLVKPDAFVLGGFSAGGTIVLRYAELCKESPAQYPIQPKAVFAVDAPVDLIDLWRFFDNQISKNYSVIAVNEANFVSDIMRREYGTLHENLDTYKKLTPFYNAQPSPGNEQYLKDIPVRVYHDVDIAWQLKNRRRSVYDSNYLNTSEMINRLLLMGNDKAEFVTGKTGYRSNGMRHPHSWSIVDATECVQWMLSIMK